MVLVFFNASFIPIVLAPLLVFGPNLDFDALLIFLAPFLISLIIIDGFFTIIRNYFKAIAIGMILGLILTSIWVYILTWMLTFS